MFTATRPARSNGASPEGAPPAAGVDMDRTAGTHSGVADTHSSVDETAAVEFDLDIEDLVARHSLPLVVIDVARAARQYRALREAFPSVEVHYDVSALAHPALIAAIAESGGSFVAAHDGALAALTASQTDLRRVLHATAATHPHEVLAAYNAGVRRFVVDGPADVEKFASAPHDLDLVVRLQPHTPPQAAHVAPRGVPARDAHRIVRDAAALGVRVAGFSLSTRQGAACQDYVAAIARTAAVMADVRAATGARLDVIDLGDGFPGRAARRPGERAELARAIRAIVAPGSSRVAITASAGHAVTAGCITIIGGTVEHDVDPFTASECIDAGAEVAILVEGDQPHPLLRFPFFRAVATGGHRILRGAQRGNSTGSTAG